MNTHHITRRIEKKENITTTRWFRTLVLCVSCALLAHATPAAEQAKPTGALPSPNIQATIDKGLSFLMSSQDGLGWWSTPHHPAVTALALTALMGDPTDRYRTNMPASLTKAYEHILGSVKSDGSIYRTSLINYNTSISMMALLAAKNPAYDTILRRARNFVVKSQGDLEKVGAADSPFDGGIGYSDKYTHSDMNNTVTALEALYYTRHLVADNKGAETRDIKLDAVIQFVQNCQNLPGYNTQSWVATDATNRGGFVYFPGDSKAGAETNAASGRVALRSYGSISYAGLLSYVYADLKREDPRVVAVLDWLRANYTLDENPGLGLQGLYYYVYLMTKALNTCGVDTLEMKDGTKINWRNEVAARLIALQNKNGSWKNTNGRWWETDPNLVTAYAVITLEIIQRGPGSRTF